jgi:aspartate/methionine/tyrosine aminotransferase
VVTVPPRAPSTFERNDFDDIYRTYFEDLIASGELAADPSGWARTEPGVIFDVSIPMPPRLLGHYVVDNRRLLHAEKEAVLELFSQWDAVEYSFEELTLTPSISSASLATLLLLRSKGVRTVIFETPAYYATIDQAEALGLKVALVPTYAETGYRWQVDDWVARSEECCAYWLSQPRYALGHNQSAEGVSELAELLSASRYLVIDETSDQCWPSCLSPLQVRGNGNIFKIRGFMKPLGLNGLRLAAVLHAQSWRPTFQELIWLVGAALDRYSLVAAAEMARAPDLFATMLAAARDRVAIIHSRLSQSVRATRLEMSRMENGYLGVVELDWRRARRRSRVELLTFCRQQRMPVTLGPAMIFARDDNRERVRLNYFMPRRDLDFCLEMLGQFVAGGP